MSALSRGLFYQISTNHLTKRGRAKYVSVPPKYALNADDNSNDVGIRNLTNAADDNVVDDKHEFMNQNYCQVKLGNCLNL